LLCRITEDGFIPSGKRQLEKATFLVINQKPTCKECGVSLLVMQALRQFFPNHWRHIVVIAYCRFVFRCLLKSIPFRQSQSYLNKLLGLTDFQRKPAVDVFETYKSRMTIEVLFDGMKNVMEADHTYMQDEQTLQGWMFINHIALQWYRHLYIEF
jgi:hypothetical protein